MIFSDPLFLFLFLPITFALFHLGLRYGMGRGLIYILILASFVFYAVWNWQASFLLVGSISLNYLTYKGMNRHESNRKLLLTGGILFNLLLLAYFKYANFFLENVYSLWGSEFNALSVMLPPGISFYTFQQITFLLETYKTRRKEVLFKEYLSFVLFFPHLIAGPIVHHNEFFPQIRRLGNKISDNYIWFGLVIFVIGLFKKVVLADQIANLVIPVFDAADKGKDVTFFDGWFAALGFTFQIYFDFSAYSDMAVGLALFFGIILPMNFNSPYKASNITVFWRHWHITLSRFLKESVYIPLGGNRRAAWNGFRNVFITMVIGGLWHGANWTFLIWGAVHGLALGIHKYWDTLGVPKIPALGSIITFVFVVLTWVLFRAENLHSVEAMYKGMAGLNGVILPADLVSRWNVIKGFPSGETFIDRKSYEYACLFFPLILLCLLKFPNSWQIIGLSDNACNAAKNGDLVEFGRGYARKNMIWVLITAVVFVISCLFTGNTENFIYFEF